MVDLEGIAAAGKRIAQHAVHTPLLRSAALNEKLDADVFLKPENLQRSGSFKFRGAFNRLSQGGDAVRQNGCVAWSSGNHAQGIAAAAQILGIAATIVMPADAPAVKVAGTRACGADIVFYDRYTESREEIGRSLAEERGAVLVPSYDDEDIITGQGTVGLELARDMQALGLKLDVVLCCCGGGGLIAGSSVAIKALSPQTQIYSVEPDAFDDHKRSLISGERETVAGDARSICDALLAPTPGYLTFPINKELLTGGLSVSDDEVKEAMRFAFDTLKLVLEPGGAVALAAALSRTIDLSGQNVGIVLSGGNVDPELFADVLTSA